MFIVGSANAQFSVTPQAKPAWATQPGTYANTPRTPEWVTLAKQGLQLREAGKLKESAPLFMSAFEQLKVQESKSDPLVVQYGLSRMDLLIGYGDVLNGLNRPDEALPILEKAAAIEQEELAIRAQRSSTSMSYLDAMSAMQATMSNAMNMAKLMNRKLLVIESENGNPYDESLVELLPDTLLTSLFLADSYSRLGNRQAVLGLYDIQFQAYLVRQRGNNNPDARFNLDLAMETACLRFALVLARVGSSQQQEQAFKCALDLNLANQRTVGTSAIVASAQEGIASQRRLFVGAYADQAMQNAARDGIVQRRLVELIADSKGLSTRYLQRLRQLIFHSANPRLQRLRAQFESFEDARKDLPVTGTESVIAMVNWENGRAAVMREALPELIREGLGDTFVDGGTILNRAQAKLQHEVLIGYSIYRPIDLITLAPLPGRVLRYSVTKTAVEVQDIGTQKEIEGLVYRWRGAVATNTEATSIPLHERLLGGLPVTVSSEKSWVIDPDGAIALVPFEALSDSNGVRVIDSHSVRYVTSIASFANTPYRFVRSESTALVVANPEFETDSKASNVSSITRSIPTASGMLLDNMKFAPLPHTAKEASTVQESLARLGVKSDMRLGSQATMESLSFTTGPRYLHIATHGIYMAPGTDQKSRAFFRVATAIPGMQSALVFSPSSKGSIFTGADFARLPLNGTELVVLSACDTGNGSVNVGEGVASLRMAVEEAGAQSSITSLWPVPSDATARLMGAFYAQLGLGNSKVESLRLAKLQLMKTHPEPANWAGFLLSGQP